MNHYRIAEESIYKLGWTHANGKCGSEARPLDKLQHGLLVGFPTVVFARLDNSFSFEPGIGIVDCIEV